MTRTEITNFLSSRRGYLKYSYNKLANMLNSDVDTIKSVVNKLTHGEKPTETFSGKATIQTPQNAELWEQFQQYLKSKETNKVQKKEKNIKINKGIHLVSGCLHIPFHNKEMLNGMLSLIKDLDTKLTGLHFLGDFLDMSSLSSHDKGQVSIPGITLGKEYKEGNKVLDLFNNAIGNREIEKSFIYGNHEDRYKRHIADSDNAKYADALISPKEALKLEERGYTVYTNWKEDHHLLGSSLQLIHGEYCSKSPARTHMDKLKASVMFAHTHRIDIVYDGEKAAFNIGWGGDKDAPAFGYVSRITKMNWINGFALVHIDELGNFHTQVIPVYKNKFWYNGKCY